MLLPLLLPFESFAGLLHMGHMHYTCCQTLPQHLFTLVVGCNPPAGHALHAREASSTTLSKLELSSPGTPSASTKSAG